MPKKETMSDAVDTLVGDFRGVMADCKEAALVSSCCHAYLTPQGLCAKCQQQSEPEPWPDC
jgi:hypothetical protein